MLPPSSFHLCSQESQTCLSMHAMARQDKFFFEKYFVMARQAFLEKFLMPWQGKHFLKIFCHGMAWQTIFFEIIVMERLVKLFFK
jgi:hypothetical protein